MDDKIKLFKCEDGFYYVEKSADLVWLGHWEGSERDEGTATYMSKEAALGLAAELTRAAGGDPEPHIWEVYVKGLHIYEQLSLHATKEGAELEVEAQKKAWPEETSDPNFIVAARKLRIGA